MLSVKLSYILTINTCLFLIGLLGVVINRKNVLVIIMSIELLLLSVNLNFVTFSIYLDDIVGQIFVLFILTVAATESAIGLAMLIVLYGVKNSIDVEPVKKKPINKV